MKRNFKKRQIILAALVLVIILGSTFLSSCGSAAGPAMTSAMVVDVSKLADYQFMVPSDTDLTLGSTDAKSHTCKILGINKQVDIPAGKVSATFQLPSGEYKLNCGIPNINAKITSR